MIVEQIIKTLNKTELCLLGGHERYAQCRQIDCLEEWHKDADNSHKIEFTDKETGDLVKFNIYFNGQVRGSSGKVNRENRIVAGVDYFANKKNLQPGDSILFEKLFDEQMSISSYYVDVERHDKRITFQKSKDSLVVLNIDKLNSFIEKNGNELKISYNGYWFDCRVELLEDDFCKIIFSDGENTPFSESDISKDDLLILDLENKKISQVDPLLFSRFQY